MRIWNMGAVAVSALALAGCGGGGGGPPTPTPPSTAGGQGLPPQPVPAPAPTPSPSPAPVPPSAPGSQTLGLNVASYANWNNERSFQNLTMGAFWMSAMPGRPWVDMSPARVNLDGSMKALQPGEIAMLPLSVPAHNPTGVRIRCTYRGSGTLSVGYADSVQSAPGTLEFTSMNVFPNPQRPYLALAANDPADPIRQIDCREAGAPAKLFADEFINFLRPYGTIRFLNWQHTNANKGGKWAERSRPEAFVSSPTEGVAVEHMMALANEVGANPWFLMPYNADEEYITRFAQYVRDTLPPGRKVYVELGNEVWNYIFPATHQAIAEGEAAGLDRGWGAGLKRYSQKSAWALQIWTRVFADRPDALVRVVSAQHDNSISASIVMAYPGTADSVDALATAPYFGFDIFSHVPENASTDELMIGLGNRVDAQIAASLTNRNIARSYGKRHLAYEAGQHVVTSDISRLTAIQRHPKMYDLYTRYIDAWREQQGDLMMLYSSTSPISQYGAFGMREYSGQPLSETPKRRAIEDAIRR